jgi:hypothetical protein
MIAVSQMAERLAAGQYVAVWFGQPDSTGVAGFPVRVTRAVEDVAARPAARWRLWFGDCPTLDDGASVAYAAGREFHGATQADVTTWVEVTLPARNAAAVA